MGRSLNFQIEGEFICEMARSWFWDENKPYETCEELLLSVLVTDELSVDERKEIVRDILEGRMILKGVNHFTLEEDGRNIRPITQKIEDYRIEDEIRKLKSRIEFDPLAYMDWTSCSKTPDEIEEDLLYDVLALQNEFHYEDRKNLKERFGLSMAPLQCLYVLLYSDITLFSGGKRRLKPEYYEVNSRPALANGMFLIEHPDILYEIRKNYPDDPETGLTEYLDHEYASCSPSMKREIRMRKNRIEARNRIEEPVSKKQCILPQYRNFKTDDDMNQTTEPDQFRSEYGLIAPDGSWYSCGFGGHAVKAACLLEKKYGLEVDVDQALETLYRKNWMAVRNPMVSGSPYLDAWTAVHATKRQTDTAFDYMVHFGLTSLPGMENYLDL